MTAVRREGKWTLEKVEDGLYEVCKRGQVEATIVTNDYEPTGMLNDATMDLTGRTIEVANFSAAESEFQEIAEQGGLNTGLF